MIAQNGAVLFLSVIMECYTSTALISLSYTLISYNVALEKRSDITISRKMQSDLENSEKVAACGNEYGTLAIRIEVCCWMDLCYELGTLAICTERCCSMDVCYETYVEGWVFK